MAFDGVAGAQAEAADLRWRDVDVVRARQIIGVGRAQEAETVGQNLDDAFADDIGFLAIASCLRMANISSCLRMVLAFSTPFSSANETSSAGVLDLRS